MRLDLVPGEYPHIARGSRDLDLLLAAHGTPCTTAEARSILAALQVQHGITDLAVTFRKGSKGRGGRRAVYQREKVPTVKYVRYESTDGVDYDRVPTFRYRKTWTGRTELFITLPSNPHDPCNPAFVRYGLRVGIVLHEFAHAMLCAGGSHRGHGPEFVDALDNLVAWWWHDWARFDRRAA